MTLGTEMAKEEEEIIRRVLAGEKELYRELVSAHKNKVYSTIRRQIADASVAEDLAQETFIRAYRGLSEFRADSSFSTWLIRIALNLCSNYFSSRAFKERSRTDGFELAKHDHSEQGQSRISAEELDSFRRALSRLQPKYREVLVLVGLEGFSYEAVSESLKIPIGTVRSRLHQARLLLREALSRA